MGEGVIFLIQPDEKLVSLKETDYESEDLLQRLLAHYPDILAGEQIDNREPRRWLLISREYGVPAEDDGADRWSIDHLFVDQDGVPTLVEVKRSSDTRIRREVVGQMFDYAANAVLYWPPVTIQHAFEERCNLDGLEPGQILAEHLENADTDAFWQAVKTNLEAGHVRLVFVADEIPTELRTIVDFLAKQMNPAEAFAIEVKQYIGTAGGADDKPVRSLVSRLVAGRPPTQITTPAARWTAERFFATLNSMSASDVPTAHKLVDFGSKLTERAMEPGVGAERGSLTARLKVSGFAFSLFSVYTTGDLSINIGWSKRLKREGGDLSEHYRSKAADAGFVFDRSSWENGWPMVKLAVVEQKLGDFEQLMTSVARELREWATKMAASTE